MTYSISHEAVSDLEKIWVYTFENWSTKQADRYINLIFNEIEFICGNPLSGSNINHIKSKYFRIKVKSNFIYYKIDEKKQTIEIIRILHEMMDQDSHIWF
jgi:toxin ParE1/3/4